MTIASERNGSGRMKRIAVCGTPPYFRDLSDRENLRAYGCRVDTDEKNYIDKGTKIWYLILLSLIKSDLAYNPKKKGGKIMNHLRPIFFILLAAAVAVTLTAGSLPAAEKININTASKKELVQLDRIGPTLAERIIKYREEQGPFEKPGDIIKVKGIGARTFRAFSDRITVGEPKKKAKEADADRKTVSDAEKPEKKVEEVKTAEASEKKDSVGKAAGEKAASPDKRSSEE